MRIARGKGPRRARALFFPLSISVFWRKQRQKIPTICNTRAAHEGRAQSKLGVFSQRVQHRRAVLPRTSAAALMRIDV
jgi:hypothetical protein